jgi:hypothetical protein
MRHKQAIEKTPDSRSMPVAVLLVIVIMIMPMIMISRMAMVIVPMLGGHGRASPIVCL